MCIPVSAKTSSRAHWAALRKWVRARAIVVHWFALTSHLYTPGGAGFKRDRAAFEADDKCLLAD